MGYSIIYDRQFIKVSETQFVPMILCGDNNSYEDTRTGKRSRSWWGSRHVCPNGVFTTTGDIENIFEKDLADTIKSFTSNTPDEIKNNYGSYTSLSILGRKFPSFNQIKSYYINGCKSALTIEDLRKHGVNVSVGTSRYDEENLKKKGLIVFPFVTVKSTEQFWGVITSILLAHGDLGYCQVEISEWAMERLRDKQQLDRKINSRNSYEYKTVEGFYAIKYPNHGYFLKGTKYGFRYSYYSDGGRKFETLKEAERFLSRRYDKEKFVIEQVFRKATIRVKKKKLKTPDTSNTSQLSLV